MFRFLLTLCFATTSLVGLESNKYISFADTEGQPSALMCGCVNAITGDYVEVNSDLIVKGPHPLVFERSYASSAHEHGSLMSGWRHNYGSLLGTGVTNGLLYSYYLSPHGSVTVYSSSDNGPKRTFDISLNGKGLTNCGRGEINAITNLKNQVVMTDQMNTTVISGGNHKSMFPLYAPAPYPAPIQYEKFPDEMLLRYHYKTPSLVSYSNGINNNPLVKISLRDPHEQELASISIDRKDNEWKLVASNGQQVSYYFQLFKVTKKQRDAGIYDHHYLEKVIRADGETESFQYTKRVGEGAKCNGQCLSRKQLPDNRFIEISYYGADPNNFLTDRVWQLREPIGTDARPIVSATFRYQDLKDGKLCTDMYDAYNHKTSYYSTDCKLTAIEKFSNKGTYCIERFRWGDDKGPLSTQLLSHSLEDKTGKIEWCRSYHYDERGNILHERLYATLTGTCRQPILIQNGDPVDNGAEFEEKRYTYSNDGYNHLLSEECGQKKTTYTYDPITHNISGTFVWGEGRIQKRHFYEYNKHCLVQLEIEDDGCSTDSNDLTAVTQRHIKKISYAGSFPKQEEKWVLDLSTSRLLLQYRLVNTHSPEGYLLKQEHYNADNQYAYTLYWDYDRQGNIVKETDPYGATTEKKYDPNHNLIYQKSKRGTTTHYTYDFSNRLIKEKEIDIDGTELITSHRYDLLGNRITTIDPQGQQTGYTYDNFGRVISKTTPSIIDSQNKVVVCKEMQTYSLNNHPTSFTDPLGNTTHTQPNIRGKPLKITYPDGSSESFTYDQTGQLLTSHTMKNGTTVIYTYDYQDRLLEKATYFNDQLLKTEKYRYNALHLLSSTDPEGTVTTYTYDPFGRLSSKTIGDRTTRYQYNNLGQPHQQITQNTIIITLYDFLDRLIEENVADENQIYTTKRYRYDSEGNRISTVQGQATTTTTYNAHRQPIILKDPLGYTTRITYNYHFINSHRQKVLQKIEIDPLNQRHITTYDTHRYPSTIEIYSPHGQLLSKTERTYDACHRLIQNTQNAFTVKYMYNTLGQLTQLVEAVGTPNQRSTHYTYDVCGKKSSTLKPDGVRLCYSYDPLERLQTLSSSDNTISYHYTYNRNDLPTDIVDRISKGNTHRDYNIHKQITREVLANGLSNDYRYSSEGKLTAITLPDQTTIHYTHTPAALETVYYQDITHTYAYDDQNHIIRSGNIHYTRDLLGRPTSIIAPHYTQQNLSYDPAGNLISYDLDSIPRQFTYDPLYQLTSENDHTYNHDALYNRTSKDNTSYNYNTLNQLISQGAHSYTYDPNGNLIATTGTTCTYDALNRLTSCTKDGITIAYTYDPFNRRLTDNEKRYLYLFQNEIGAYQGNELMQLRILGQGLGAEIGAAVAIYLQDEWYIPVHDHQGNTSVLLTPDNNLVESYSHTCFGEEDNPNSINPWRLFSKRRDPHTHWINFGHRDYDPTIGRWLTPDPIGYDDILNLYPFVKNNPHHYIDPDGRFVFAIPVFTVVFGVKALLVTAGLTTLALPALRYGVEYGIAYLHRERQRRFDRQWEANKEAQKEEEKKKRKFNEECEEEERRKYNTNPFNGAVNGDVVVVDEAGNAIKVPPGNWLTGTKDGKWIQEMKPGVGPKGEPTGQRKDGGGHPPPKHTNTRANDPHAHVPGITNPDGTEWLPIKK